jgi:hypothetical protein
MPCWNEFRVPPPLQAALQDQMDAKLKRTFGENKEVQEFLRCPTFNIFRAIMVPFGQTNSIASCKPKHFKKKFSPTRC